MKRTPFKTRTPFKRTAWKKKRRTQLNPVSTNQRAKAASFASAGPIELGKLCDKCGTRQATDKDHMQRRSRRPDLVGDPANRRDLCRPCHRLVTDEPDIEGETYEKARTAALHWHPANQGEIDA